MTETGKIVRISNDIIYTECINNGTSCGSCNCCSNKQSRKQIEALNKAKLDLKIGDAVKIYISPFKAIISGFIVLIFPLIIFFLAYLFSIKFFFIGNEGIGILSALSGLVLGFVISYFISLGLKKTFMPEISEKYL